MQPGGEQQGGGEGEGGGARESHAPIQTMRARPCNPKKTHCPASLPPPPPPPKCGLPAGGGGFLVLPAASNLCLLSFRFLTSALRAPPSAFHHRAARHRQLRLLHRQPRPMLRAVGRGTARVPQ